jgi:formylglycine-generating enzyme required for sulfatase activity
VAAAGDRTPYAAPEVGWFQTNSGNTAHPVASKAPNSLGMFDMFGNVSEWTQDFYVGTRPTTPQTDWVGPPSGRNRTAKGSAYLSSADQLRPGYRYGVEPEFRGTGLGFRIARTVR